MAIVHPIPPGARIGQGVDIDLGENYSVALEFEPATTLLDDNGKTSGQSVDFYLTQITSNQELTKSLNISASASLGIGLFSGSAEARYASQQQINHYSTYLLVSVVVSNPDLVIENPRFKPDARNLLQNRGWEAFEQQYGSRYLAGVRSGGSYHALITIDTSSRQEQTEIAAAVSASYGTFNVSGKLDRKLTEALENKTLKITILQRGGSGDNLEVSLEKMIEQAQNFPKLVVENPVTSQGIFEEYHKTVSPQPPPIGDGVVSRIHRETVMNELAEKYLMYKDYRANLRYVLNHFATFEEHLDLNPTERRKKIANYERDFEGVSDQLNQIERLARDCRNSTDACQLPSSYFTSTEPLPTFDGENLMLKKMEQELAAVRQQVQRLQSDLNSAPIRAGQEWEIAQEREDLVIREPEQKNKVWARFKDDQHLHLIGTPNLLVNGSVGVGTRSPQAKLDVKGEIRAAELDVKGEIRGKLWYSRKYTWRQGQAPTKMLHSDKGFPVLTRIQGEFEGSGEWIDTFVDDDGYWYMRGRSAQKGLYAEAIFVGTP